MRHFRPSVFFSICYTQVLLPEGIQFPSVVDSARASGVVSSRWPSSRLAFVAFSLGVQNNAVQHGTDFINILGMAIGEV